MNIFSNADRNVQTFSMNKKKLTELDKMSEAVTVSEALKELKNKENLKAINENINKKIIEDDKQEKIKKVVMNSLTEGKINNTINRISKDCMDNVFKEILFETFRDSLWLDDDFVEENINKISNVVERYVDDNGGYSILENAITTHPDSILLKKMNEVCKSTATKVSRRKLMEIKTAEDADNAKSDLNEDERKELDTAKDNLNTEEISKLVKNKVLTVIQDEKERADTEGEIVEKIENELKNDEDVKDEDSLKEALAKSVINNSPYEEATLFNALLRNTYEEIMTENVAIASDVKNAYDDRHDTDYDYNPDGTIKDFDEEHTVDKVSNDDDSETEINDDLSLEITNELAESSVSVDMDAVLAETIVKYSLMETLYTLKLESYSAENIRKLTQNIVNVVLENKSNKPSDNESNGFEIRGPFFKIFNNFKDLKNVDDSKEKLQKLVKSCEGDDDKIHACDICTRTGISQLEDCIEKNPALKDKYKEIIKWCNDTLLSEE